MMAKKGFLILLTTLIGSTSVFATADGPDFFRVHGVAKNKFVNIHKSPSVKSLVLGDLYHDSNGIENLGNTVPPVTSDRTIPVWCQIKHGSVVGWVKCRYLAEGTGKHPNDWTCPESLGVDPEQKLLAEATGWTANWIPHRYRFALNSIQIYAGHPSKLGTLKLPRDKKGGVVWTRQKGDGGDYYIVCEYTDTSLT